MARVPLLLIGDHPSSSTGLGRITRELAIRIHEHLGETFEVGCYGIGGINSKRFQFYQNVITKLDSWAPYDLPRVWDDFAGDWKGVIFPIWNPSSLVWLADPETLPNGTLKDFLRTKPFERWLYAPIDAVGPNGLMPADVAGVCSKFDRCLFYTEFAAELYSRTMGGKTHHLPHGTDTKIFHPRDRHEMRQTFIKTVTGGQSMPLKDEVFLIGCVATNSARKDWNLCFEVCQELVRRGVNVGLWAHTNAVKKTWDILGLAKAYFMEGRVIPTVTDLTDEQMAEAYCACDVTLALGLGEGFGMPIFESLACGVPCIHGDYGGAAEFLLPKYKVKPIAFYGEGFYANRRPVFRMEDWADKVQSVVKDKAVLPKGLSWDECWGDWQKWLLEGVNG